MEPQQVLSRVWWWSFESIILKFVTASTELSYAHIDLTDFEFYKAVSESFNKFTDFSDDEINEQEDELNTLEYENDNDNLFENNKEVPNTGNEMIMENYFNFDDEDLQKVLELEVRVVIEQEITNYNYRENDYDINALLNANFNKGQNKE